MTKDDLNDEELLRYLQIKIHEATIECVNTYKLSKEKDTLFHTFLSLVFMSFRNSVDTSISVPYRSKSFQSVINNIEKEVLKMLSKKLPDNCTKSDIDRLMPDVVNSVCKDFLAATVVFHSKNNLSTYCEESNDEYIKKLYEQVLTTDKYLRSSTKETNSSIFSKISNHFKTIDISKTFIDKELNNPLAPRKVKPLDLENINTQEDYYSTLIDLLTLLSNLSLPCTEPMDGKTHKYCVSELDVPYLQLVKQAKSQNPKNKDEFIEILIDLAHKAYYREYTPFDEQLNTALSNRNKAQKVFFYNAELSTKDKAKYSQELTNLKNNLQQMKNDRLLNYVLTLELPNIFSRLSELPNLNVEVKSHKERAKSNGFYACYYTVELNGAIILEILGNSEFRSNLTKEGYASHNLMPNKSFDIKPLFELQTGAFPFNNPHNPKEKLDFYCDFLNTVTLNDVSGYHVSQEDKESLRDLQDLVNYASSQIKVKDVITIKNGDNIREISFYDYISSVLSSHGSEYGTIYPAHIVEHNQALSVPQTPLYSLENLLKSRVGFSTLANLIREKYVEIASIDKKQRILPHSLAQAYSSTLSPKYDLPMDNHIIKNSKDNYQPLDIPFRPMGQYKKDDDEAR